MATLNAEPELAIQTFDYSRSIEIDAPIGFTFDAVLAEMGPEGQMPDGTPYPMKVEPWPGGRWYRDLWNDAGHLWGHVQVIRPPKLLELCGPMFISFPATNHIQYRLTETNGRTLLQISHRAFGLMPRDFLKDAEMGWAYGLQRIAEIASRRAGAKQEAAR